MRTRDRSITLNSIADSVFILPDRLAAKADPALIADDELFFADLAASLERSIAELSQRLDATHILNAPTRLMKDLGYGDGYQYDPDTETGFSGANYFPYGMPRQTFYEPTTGGYERAITERLRHWAQLRKGDTSDTTDSSGD